MLLTMNCWGYGKTRVCVLDFQRAKKKSSECAFAYQSLNSTEKFYFHEMWFDVNGQYGRKLDCVCVRVCSTFHTQAHENLQPKSFVVYFYFFFVYVFIYAITNRMEPKLDLKEQVIITTTQHQCKFLFKFRILNVHMRLIWTILVGCGVWRGISEFKMKIDGIRWFWYCKMF